MYFYPYMNFRSMNNKKVLDNSLKLVKEAIESKKRFQPFYVYLVQSAHTEEERQIICDIWDNKIKHDKMFNKIYRDFTGVDLKIEPEKVCKEGKVYIVNIKIGLFKALKDVERDIRIREGLPEGYYRDMLFEIIMDELKHANEYNYILSENLFKKAEIIENGKFGQSKEYMEFIKSLIKRSMREE